MPDDSVLQTPERPTVARVAAVVAFLMAAAGLLLNIHKPVGAVLGAIILLIAGFGILRQRVWSAYGMALLLLGQVIALVLLSREQSMRLLELAAGVIVALALALLFFLAGRSLQRSGAPSGRAIPWIAVACLSLLPLIFVRAYANPTGSMEDTLLVGDYLLVRVFPHVTLGRDELVVFHYPIDRSNTFVKRVIGIPGDHIRMIAKVVYRNGAVLNEAYAVHKVKMPDPYRDNLPVDPTGGGPYFVSPEVGAAAQDMFLNHVVNGEVVVPEGKYFVLGDNRDNSLDSRYWGFVDAADIIGKPILIYDSEEKDSNTRAFSLPHVRWSRLFRPL